MPELRAIQGEGGREIVVTFRLRYADGTMYREGQAVAETDEDGRRMLSVLFMAIGTLGGDGRHISRTCEAIAQRWPAPPPEADGDKDGGPE